MTKKPKNTKIKIQTYYECLDEISEMELFEGLLGYGLFAEKIPSFLSSKEFFDFAKNYNFNPMQKDFSYIKYENIRNINIPRILAIPNPFAYYKHCKAIKENWNEIKDFFRQKTQKDTHKISRIHIRKLHDKKDKSLFKNDYDDTADKKHLFEMGYKNYKIDGSPEQELPIAKKYKVKADISNCFPSIYTHTIPWAVLGKEQAKQQKYDKNLWCNKLDNATTWLNRNETHGIFIGPHSSNIISEIILVSVDYNLNQRKRYDYVRNIDDYICYVSSMDEAKQFLLDLSQALREFNLTLNHKKTEIIELPTTLEEDWVRKLKLFKMETYKSKITYTSIVPFLDTALDLMNKNENNAAILNYAIKTLIKRKMTTNARNYFINFIHHLVLIYPYLVSLLEKICDKKIIGKDKMQKIANDIFRLGEREMIYEAMIYALYFALKYDFKLDEKLQIKEQAIKKQDCLLMLLCYLYDKKYGQDLDDYITMAKSYIIAAKITTIDDEFWLFAYEVLLAEAPNELDKCKDWKQLKDKNISFLNKGNLAIKTLKRCKK